MAGSRYFLGMRVHVCLILPRADREHNWGNDWDTDWGTTFGFPGCSARDPSRRSGIYFESRTPGGQPQTVLVGGERKEVMLKDTELNSLANGRHKDCPRYPHFYFHVPGNSRTWLMRYKIAVVLSFVIGVSQNQRSETHPSKNSSVFSFYFN